MQIEKETGNATIRKCYFMKWLNRLEYKFGRYGIPHLMYLLSGIMLAVYLIDLLLPGAPLQSVLALDMGQVAHGQVWRLITFIFLPPASSPLWILFNLYFYCLIGNALESEWGSFRFNVFYLCGMVGTILAALITGYGVNSFLNLSLFLAFAALYPDFQVMVFFLIPLKVKYLAIIDLVYYGISLLFGTWASRVAILMSLLNVVLFFGGDFFRTIKQQAGYWKTRRNFRKYNR